MGELSHNKFIPENFLVSSIQNRISLLQGLMDTDGECSKSGLVYFHTSSIKLAKDVSELVGSLGGIGKISKPRARFYTYKGEKKQGLDSYYVCIKTVFNPFHLSRKAERWKPQMMARAIKSIELVGRGQAQCIRVSTKRNLYVTDDYIVTHNTISAICGTAHHIHKRPKTKVLVFGTKSTTYQWKSEYENFSTLKVEVLKDKYNKKKGSEARLEQIENLFNSDTDVLVCKYSSLVGRRRTIEGEFDQDGNPTNPGEKEETSPEVQALVELMKKYGDRLILILDECQKFKSTTSQNRKMILKIQPHIMAIWAMTATVIQNSLDEFYSIAVAIGIRPFGPMKPFREHFCIYRQVHVGQGRYKDQLEGYKNIKEFKAGMRPFYYGRSQAQVKEPLPKLSTIYHPVDLDKHQAKLILEDIPRGEYILPPMVKKNAQGELYEKERDPDNAMTMLAVTQMIANHPCLLEKHDPKAFLTKSLSPKEEALQDLLEGDLAGEKVIVFTKFRTWIDRFEGITKAGHFTDRKFLRITGAESEEQREINKQLFQNDPNYNLLFINTAAAEGVNLQSAAHMVLLDVPWSWGVLIQLVGRMVRMASPHSACTLHVIPAKGTVDEYAIDTLKGKGDLFETILGESYSAGVLNDSNDLDLASGMEQVNDDSEFLKLLKAHAKTIKMGDFISGAQIQQARDEGKDYKMSFEDKGKKKVQKRVSVSEHDFSKWKFE
jgi:SNF2 family DNA or RNA helicase